ncbi:MAG: hypothetical protein HY908_25235 [Myxococcales bacterium]|nr:hypothetical protein [Myxococcales bacterium]
MAVRLCWPFREERARLAERFEQTLAALRPLGLRTFREGPRELDPRRRFELPPSAATTEIELTAFERGRPRGVVRAELLLRPPRNPSLVNTLRVEHALPARPAQTVALVRELVTAWAPLSGACGTRSFPPAPGPDGAPVVGWLTFLAAVYGSVPSWLATTEIAGRGTLCEAPCRGGFDPKIAVHTWAVGRVREALEEARLLRPLADLHQHDLGWQDDDWRLGSSRPIWHPTPQPVRPRTERTPTGRPEARAAPEVATAVTTVPIVPPPAFAPPMVAPPIVAPPAFARPPAAEPAALGGLRPMSPEWLAALNASNADPNATAPVNAAHAARPATPFRAGSAAAQRPPAAQPPAAVGGADAGTRGRGRTLEMPVQHAPQPTARPAVAGVATDVERYAELCVACEGAVAGPALREIHARYGIDSAEQRARLDAHWRSLLSGDALTAERFHAAIARARQRPTRG